jgi:hypothetical protein
MLVRVVREEPDRAVSLPELERGRLVLALAVRLLDLQDGVLPVLRRGRANDDRRDPALERLAEGEAPALCDQASVGQRYASAWRFFSDGSFSRTSRRRARESSAEMTVSSSGACASTVPHGSTISERP